MDVGLIVSNALGGLFGGLALLLLVGVGKRLQTILKQRATQPREVLDPTLLSSQEYREILSSRKFYRIQGYATLIWLLCLIAVIIIAWVLDREIWINSKDIGGMISSFGLLITLACFSPLSLYLGHSPITSQEVERKRQQNRTRTFKEAQGARPYGYVFQEIIFPVIFWLYFIFCVISLILLLALPPTIVHLPLLLVVVVSGLAIIAGLFGTYLTVKEIYWSWKNLPYVPRQRQDELRQQLTDHEFDQ